MFYCTKNSFYLASSSNMVYGLMLSCLNPVRLLSKDFGGDFD